MNDEQLKKLDISLNRIAAATLATSLINSSNRKATLKEIQVIFEDCYMIVDPDIGSDKQTAFQARINKREW